jgi:hypothetical protein
MFRTQPIQELRGTPLMAKYGETSLRGKVKDSSEGRSIDGVLMNYRMELNGLHTKIVEATP